MNEDMFLSVRADLGVILSNMIDKPLFCEINDGTDSDLYCVTYDRLKSPLYDGLYFQLWFATNMLLTNQLVKEEK